MGNSDVDKSPKDGREAKEPKTPTSQSRIQLLLVQFLQIGLVFRYVVSERYQDLLMDADIFSHAPSWVHVIESTGTPPTCEYGYTNKVNEKSDVYNFGVVLMELVTRKRPTEVEFGEQKDMVDWVCGKLKTRESVLSVVDSAIPDIYREYVIKVLKITILCTARLPTLRPTMRTVVQMLEEAQPRPFLSIIVTKEG